MSRRTASGVEYAHGMREFLGFVLFAAIVFFAVGETVGWNVGVAGSTPVFVYKRDGGASTARRTIQRDAMPIEVEGRVRDGQVRVQIVYQDTGSFQTNRSAEPPELVFEETYQRGQRIAIDEVFDEGRGEYTIDLTFSGATGLFRVVVPDNSQL